MPTQSEFIRRIRADLQRSIRELTDARHRVAQAVARTRGAKKRVLEDLAGIRANVGNPIDLDSLKALRTRIHYQSCQYERLGARRVADSEQTNRIKGIENALATLYLTSGVCNAINVVLSLITPASTLTGLVEEMPASIDAAYGASRAVRAHAATAANGDLWDTLVAGGAAAGVFLRFKTKWGEVGKALTALANVLRAGRGTGRSGLDILRGRGSLRRLLSLMGSLATALNGMGSLFRQIAPHFERLSKHAAFGKTAVPWLRALSSAAAAIRDFMDCWSAVESSMHCGDVLEAYERMEAQNRGDPDRPLPTQMPTNLLTRTYTPRPSVEKRMRNRECGADPELAAFLGREIRNQADADAWVEALSRVQARIQPGALAARDGQARLAQSRQEFSSGTRELNSSLEQLRRRLEGVAPIKHRVELVVGHGDAPQSLLRSCDLAIRSSMQVYMDAIQFLVAEVYQ